MKESIIVTALILAIWIIGSTVSISHQETLRQKCNNAIFAYDVLDTGVSGFILQYDEATTTVDIAHNVKNLSKELNATNVEVNKLRKLLGCYFDK